MIVTVNRNNLIKFLIAILPTLFMFYLLIELFPYTGLGRIVALPFIFTINAIIIIVGIARTQNKKQPRYSFIWIAIVFLTIMTTVVFYPQESRPNVIKQTWHGVLAIKNIDHTTLNDLELQNSSQNYSSPGSTVKNPKERYVVALYKYREQIPLDGTYHIYQRESSYFFDTSIRSINDIPTKLMGYHKVMWWFLDTFK